MSEELLIFLLIPVYIAVVVFYAIALWKIFEKAGIPGWKCLIPFYNIYVLLETLSKPGLWLILMFIPLVNIVVGVIITIELAKVFGKSGWFAAGLIFLPMIFYPILGFGDAEYSNPKPEYI